MDLSSDRIMDDDYDDNSSYKYYNMDISSYEANSFVVN